MKKNKDNIENIDEQIVNQQEEQLDLTSNDENSVENNKSKVRSFFVKIGAGVCGVGKTLWRWIKRMFMGASKELATDDAFAVEKIESPSKLAFKSFFRKKIALAATIVLVLMFLFVFIGPLFVSIDLNATDSTQKNIGPNLTMRSVPRKLKNDIKSISSYSSFSVGVSNSNDLYIWGYTKLSIQDINLKHIPEELKGEKVAFAAAGSDHIVAITEKGKIVAWGDNSNGQFGGEEKLGIIPQPQELIDNGVDVNNVKELLCGNQATVIVMNDGTVYAWGNTNTIRNIEDVSKMTNVEKIVLGNSAALALLKDGTITTGSHDLYPLGIAAGKTVVDIAASNYAIGIVTSDGEILVSGAAENGEDKVPVLSDGSKYVQISAGTKHFAAVTDKGVVHLWGSDFYGQTKLDGYEGATRAIATSLQTYIIGKGDKLLKTCGLRGYTMGTDGMGRDVFARIVHGGKMTMTIGAVAVIISTIIAVIVGCVSGYFGGWVDMLLMRISEIVSAIPFLPFAMMLSFVIRSTPINDNETLRIFIIMFILGVLSWTGLAHMIRGQVLAEREKEFVIAAKAMGVKESRIAFRHILPNVISVILVSVTLDFAGCMLTESSLSYLGFGVQQPQPTWGNMLNGANNSIVIQNYWWQWLFPSIFLGISTICVNIIGDALRDVMDPKSSSER